MSKDHLKGSLEKKEVSRSEVRASKPSIGSKAIRNALLVAGGISAGGAAPLALEGCVLETGEGSQERVGHTSEALSSEICYNAPTKLPWSDGLVGGIYPVRSGSNIKIISDSARAGGSGGGDIWVVGSNDNGVTWTSPSLTPVGYSGSGTAINSASNESAAVVFNSSTQIFISRSNKIQLCDWNDALNQGGNCLTIGANINKAGHVVFATDVDNGNLYYSDQNPVQNDIFSTPIGALPLAAGAAVSSLNTSSDESSITFNGTYGIVMTKGQAGNQGGYDMYGFDWNGGTKTASNITNLNVIAGSYGSFNTATDQGPMRVDTSVGDMWYVDNGDIYWSTKISGGADAGTDGGAGMEGGSDAGPDGSTGDGGSPINCPIVQVTQKPENFQTSSCDNNGLSAKLLGPTTYSIGKKTWTITNIVPNTPGGFNYTVAGSYAYFDPGVEKKFQENETDPGMMLKEDQYGDITGAEGTGWEDTVPDELNPNKNQGQIDIIASKTTDAKQRKYLGSGCDWRDLTKCTPEPFVVAGNPEGEVPLGVTFYKELRTKKVSDNPNDFQSVPPIKDPTGCSCSEIQNHSANHFAEFFTAAGFIGLIVRRRKDRNKA